LSTFGDIEKWINSLPILEKRKRTIISALIAEEISFHNLLDPTISLEHTILPLITNLKFTSGCVLEIISSIGKLRNENQIAQLETTESINILLAQERQEYSQREESSETNNSVFISYCWANKTVVMELNKNLKKSNINCWIDDSHIVGGKQLYEEIEKGISNCQLFIACCSNNYSTSPNCQRELLLAIERNKLIIPVLIASCDQWPPKGQMGPLLAGKIYVDLSGDKKFGQNIDQLISAINQSLL